VEAEGNLRPIDALRSLLEAALALQTNTSEQSPQVKLQKSAGLELLRVANLPNAPAGVEPTFAFGQRGLIVGSSPQIVERVATLDIADSLAASATLRNLLGPRLTAPSQLAYLHVSGLRRLLAADPERIATALAPGGEEKREEAGRGLRELAALLDLADFAAVAAQVEADAIRFSASVSLDSPAN
jgi:hypothetical protein